MSAVFISYSHVDLKIADKLCEILDECGIKHFRDVKDIEWGDSINIEVRNALEQNYAILVIVSTASLQSQWVPYEIGFAAALNKKILPFLVPNQASLKHFQLRMQSEVFLRR